MIYKYISKSPDSTFILELPTALIMAVLHVCQTILWDGSIPMSE